MYSSNFVLYIKIQSTVQELLTQLSLYCNLLVILVEETPSACFTSLEGASVSTLLRCRMVACRDTRSLRLVLAAARPDV